MKNHDKCILNKTVKNFNKSLAWAHAQIWEVYYSVRWWFRQVGFWTFLVVHYIQAKKSQLYPHIHLQKNILFKVHENHDM